MNAITEQFMALQKYLWMFKTPISNTTYELDEQESAVYSYININTYSNKELSNHKWAQHHKKH